MFVKSFEAITSGLDGMIADLENLIDHSDKQREKLMDKSTTLTSKAKQHDHVRIKAEAFKKNLQFLLGG
jgi:hypothetical protein